MKEAYFTQESIRRKSLEMLESVGEMRHRQPLAAEQCALLVLDVQKYFFSEASHAFIPSAAAIVNGVNRLSKAFGARGLPVIMTRHINSPEDAGRMSSGIAGLHLVSLLERQLTGHGVEVLFEEVINVGLDGDAFCVETTQRHWMSLIVIVASGTKPRKISDVTIPSGAEERIFYEMYPLRDVVGKTIAIVRAGDAAFDYALNLGRNNDITILNRSEKSRCLQLHADIHIQ